MAIPIIDFEGFIQIIRSIEDFWLTMLKLPTEEDS